MTLEHLGAHSSAPVQNGVAVTPSDSVDLEKTSRGLWVGVKGDISVEMAGEGSALVLKNAERWLPIAVTRVNATGTTATDIVAVW